MTIHHARRSFALAAFFYIAAFLLTALDSGATVSAQSNADLRQFNGSTMGTSYMVKVVGADDVDDDTLKISIDAELRQVNDEMSTYLESSEITRFNESSSTDWFSVSAPFAEVVDFAQQVSRKTDGAFDVTVGPLVNAWSFGPTERTNTVPGDGEIEKLRQIVGFDKLDVRLDPPALRKSVPELRVDLSSIAKGHGVDRVIERLQMLGVEAAFVEIGGEVRTMGKKPDGAWRVGIQLPDATRDTVMIAHAMNVDDKAGNAMATSGDYRNFFTAEGKRYSHTIDPRTAKPIEHNLASITVVAPTCMAADAWATALSVVGTEVAVTLANEHQLNVLLAERQEDTFAIQGTGNLAGYAEDGEATDQSATSTSSSKKEKSLLQDVLPIAILSFGVFSILLFAMALGVIFGRKQISGSCGGLNNQTNSDGSTSCSLCSNPSDACRELREKMATNENAT
ncbi:FAD:protein FMN transferase [Roseiconus lacunae]|uniref:FAD:protein FMN transferase n=1 Tax=Roseiconus lacunae TaxID=2605694 RepID=A0ABT7PDH6_9BACT|nr:FAD:protein FMN transferase [Roseiconus lacunae]MDM4014261.1 FAD:protein FMN transferase [Roseiconus lacunae]